MISIGITTRYFEVVVEGRPDKWSLIYRVVHGCCGNNEQVLRGVVIVIVAESMHSTASE